MKNNYTLTAILLLIAALTFSSCEQKNENPVDPPVVGGEGATATYTTNDYGSLNYDNFSLVIDKGDVPTLSGGAPGTVVFSLNTSSSVSSGTPAVPSGYSVIGKYLTTGPQAFNFAGPIQLYFPASGEPSPQNLVVLSYSGTSNEWKIVPTSAIDTAGKRIGVDVLELGYYVLTKRTSVSDASDYRAGGCVLEMSEIWTNYILTVNSASPEKPEILNFYAGGYIGRIFSGPIFLGCPNGKTKAIVPQGVSTFWVSKTVCQGGDPQVYTYTLPASVTVSEPLNFVGWSTYDAVTYVPFTLPPGGTWVAGRPSGGAGAWPTPTQPFGSGTFQATLTWHNSSGDAADLDLHLYGPNNLHVYYGATTSPNFSLDRDWQSAVGNAIENIFSTTATVPVGAYEVKVKNYSGVTKSFNVRVILNGSSTNYTGSLSQSQETTAYTFTIQ